MLMSNNLYGVSSCVWEQMDTMYKRGLDFPTNNSIMKKFSSTDLLISFYAPYAIYCRT